MLGPGLSSRGELHILTFSLPRVPTRTKRLILSLQHRLPLRKGCDLSGQGKNKCHLEKEWWKLKFCFQNPLDSYLKCDKRSEMRYFSRSLSFTSTHTKFRLNLGCFIFTFPQGLCTYSSHSLVSVWLIEQFTLLWICLASIILPHSFILTMFQRTQMFTQPLKINIINISFS